MKVCEIIGHCGGGGDGDTIDFVEEMCEEDKRQIRPA